MGIAGSFGVICYACEEKNNGSGGAGSSFFMCIQGFIELDLPFTHYIPDIIITIVTNSLQKKANNQHIQHSLLH